MLALMEATLRLVERPRPGETAAQQLGREGERAAYFFLRRSGYIGVARRWRYGLLPGEVDLIAWDSETLVFVEVKSRGSRTAFAAEFRVDRGKAETLRRMAEAYIQQMPWRGEPSSDLQVRFDVVSVYMDPGTRPDIRLLRDAIRG